MKKKILVVDDEGELLQYLGHKLEKEDYEPILAHDGEEGLKLIQEQKIDAVLTDVVMGGMDGYALCRKMKETATLSEIPVVVCTAHASQERTFRQLGIDDYLVKPFTFDELHVSLQRIFNRLSSAMKYKKILVQGADESVLYDIERQMEEYGCRVEIINIPGNVRIVEEALHVKPDIAIFDVSQKVINPERIIKDLSSYVELRGIGVIGYLTHPGDGGKKKISKKEQKMIDSLREACLDAGALAVMDTLNHENLLSLLFEHCKNPEKIG